MGVSTPEKEFCSIRSIMQKGNIVATSGLLHKHCRCNMLPKRSGQPRIARFCPGSSVKKLQLTGKELKLQEPPNSRSSIAGLAPATMVVQPPRCLRGALPLESRWQRIIMKKLRRKSSYCIKRPYNRYYSECNPLPFVSQ